MEIGRLRWCKFMSEQTWKIGDCLEIMQELPTDSIDIIIADPPYYKIKDDEWDNQWKSFKDYLDWLEVRAIEMKRVLKNNGSLYMFGDDHRIAYIQVMMDKHFTFLNHLVWYKRNNQAIKGAENGRRFVSVSERILFYSSIEHDVAGLSAVEKEYVAPQNPFAIKIKKARLNEGLSINQVAEFGHFYGNVNHGGAVTNWENGYNIPSKEQWKILCECLPSLKHEYNHLRCEYVDLRQEYEDLRKDYEDLRRPFNYTKGMYEVFDIPIISGKENTNHSTTKPLEVITRLIKTSMKDGAVVLDPFCGSGTTLEACMNLDLDCLAIDLSDEWVPHYKKRLKSDNSKLMDFL